MAILQGVWKQHLRPRAVVGYRVKIFLPGPPNYVTRSPGYDPSQEKVVRCDASPKRARAALNHIMSDGSERPVIFAVKAFHQYIYRRHFVVCTDHKPLLGLFGENKSHPLSSSGP